MSTATRKPRDLHLALVIRETQRPDFLAAARSRRGEPVEPVRPDRRAYSPADRKRGHAHAMRWLSARDGYSYAVQRVNFDPAQYAEPIGPQVAS